MNAMIQPLVRTTISVTTALNEFPPITAIERELSGTRASRTVVVSYRVFREPVQFGTKVKIIGLKYLRDRENLTSRYEAPPLGWVGVRQKIGT